MDLLGLSLVGYSTVVQAGLEAGGLWHVIGLGAGLGWAGGWPALAGDRPGNRPGRAEAGQTGTTGLLAGSADPTS